MFVCWLDVLVAWSLVIVLCLQARMDLDIIAAYMVDFNKIVFEAPKSVRHGGDFAAPGAPGRKAAAAAEKKPQQQPEAQPPAGK